jgi:hypothetical protein
VVDVVETLEVVDVLRVVDVVEVEARVVLVVVGCRCLVAPVNLSGLVNRHALHRTAPRGTRPQTATLSGPPPAEAPGPTAQAAGTSAIEDSAVRATISQAVRRWCTTLLRHAESRS